MSRTWEKNAPAKVNLELHVFAVDHTGYHRIETVFQQLELADGVRIELRNDGEFTVSVTGAEVGPADQNLTLRAARRFAEALPGRGTEFPGIHVDLTKRIPVGAGLGGGSSDAAAVLLGLNELCAFPLDRDSLVELSGEIGSDVPFFTSRSARAIGRGRGDRLESLDVLPTRPVLVVVPPETVSTAWAYGVLDRYRETGCEDGTDRLEIDAQSRRTWTQVEAHAHNDFETALFPLRPGFARIKHLLEQAGAAPALLSGSGSTLFGVFRNDADLDAARSLVSARLPEVRTIVTRTVA